MASNWVTLSGPDIAKVLQIGVIQTTNQNIAANDAAWDETNDAYDATVANRKGALVAALLIQFRAAIQNAGRNPLSVTAACVPPEAELHVLNIAAFQLVNSTPNLQMVVVTEKGVYSGLQVNYKESLAYLKKLGEGWPVTPPTDPTGIDYLTAVSDTNPAITGGVSWNAENKLIHRTHPTPAPARQFQSTTDDMYANPNGPQDP